MKKLMILSTLALALVAQGALAETAPVAANPADKEARRAERHEKMHQKWLEQDTNKDGKVEKSEFLAKSEEMFNTMDANKDGAISADERKAAHEERRKKWMEHKANKTGPDGGVKSDAPVVP